MELQAQTPQRLTAQRLAGQATAARKLAAQHSIVQRLASLRVLALVVILKTRPRSARSCACVGGMVHQWVFQTVAEMVHTLETVNTQEVGV